MNIDHILAMYISDINMKPINVNMISINVNIKEEMQLQSNLFHETMF